MVVTDSAILLVCRRETDPSGITWHFPAGIVKPGATPAMIAIRETVAETGVHCAVRTAPSYHLGPPVQRVHVAFDSSPNENRWSVATLCGASRGAAHD